MRAYSPASSPGLSARAAIILVRFYQRFLSCLKPPTCRFYPTCSEYALQAIANCGLVRGLVLAAWRVLRCNPFSDGGYDPGPWAEGAPEVRPGSAESPEREHDCEGAA